MVVFGRPFFLCQGCVLSVLFPRFGGQASGRRYGSSTSIIICSDLHAPLLGWSPMARGYASNSMSRELEIAFAGWSFCVWGRLLARPRKRRPRARSVLLLLLLLLGKRRGRFRVCAVVWVLRAFAGGWPSSHGLFRGGSRSYRTYMWPRFFSPTPGGGYASAPTDRGLLNGWAPVTPLCLRVEAELVGDFVLISAMPCARYIRMFT